MSEKKESKKTINVGIDLGNSETKVFGNGIRYKFPSKILSGYDDFSEIEKIKVEYERTLYSVGIGALNINKAKYFDEIYKILLLTAITKIADEQTNDLIVNLVLSLPIDVYKDNVLREKIRKKILDYKTQKIIIEDKEFNITFNKVDVWVESGVMILNSDGYMNRKVIICDIGGKTRDTLEILSGRIGKSKTENKGILTLREEIHSVFRKEFSMELDEVGKDELLESVIKNEKFYIQSLELDVSKYLSYVDNYVASIFDSLEEVYHLDSKEIEFIGGGTKKIESILLEKYSGFYKFKILKDAEYLNAMSNLKYVDRMLS